jgi:toxin ParE1/3/4
MKLTLHRARGFNADFDMQYRWYLEKAGEDVAERFLQAVLATLRLLAAQPDLGRRRTFRNSALNDLRSFRVERPFNRMLIFYRTTEVTLTAWRIMDGARDLTRRLSELPGLTD